MDFLENMLMHDIHKISFLPTSILMNLKFIVQSLKRFGMIDIMKNAYDFTKTF